MAPLSLIDILSNEYLLLSTTPYLLPKDLLALSLCSHSFYSLLIHSRSVWRHLNLSANPHPRSPQEPLSVVAQRNLVPVYQTEFPPHAPGLLTKPFVLRDVKTLVLDGLPVTVDVLNELLSVGKYRIQILSIRECLNINERQLMQLLQYLVRPSRPHDTPSLKGCYYFSDMDSPGGVFSSATRGHDPKIKGRFIKASKLTDAWVGTLTLSAGTIAFDTCLCPGSRHTTVGEKSEQRPKIANVRLSGRCSECRQPPNNRLEQSNVLFPPVPLTTSDIRAAYRTPLKEPDMLRCEACVKDRWCGRCGKWWCEECTRMLNDKGKRLVTLECYECGSVCDECVQGTSRTCSSCRGGYCIIHTEGADNVWVRLNPPTFPVLPGQRCVCPFWSQAFADADTML